MSNMKQFPNNFSSFFNCYHFLFNAVYPKNLSQLQWIMIDKTGFEQILFYKS